MVVAQAPQRLKEAEITEQDSLLLTRNLLRIAIFNISYIRGLFPEKYFNDKSVPALEMKIKKLMPMDAESRRLIDWMEKGVYDALQKKYLKTLLFCICQKEEGPMIEEYAFSFSYPSVDNDEVTMNISRRGNKNKGATFTSNTTEITPDQMRSSACKMVRTLVQLMRTLDEMPEERTILMKLLYYDNVTPEDYEPPFFRGCSENEANSTWLKNPLRMEVGNVNSKHLILALKVKSVLDPCEDENDGQGDDDVSLGDDSALHNDSSSDSEVRPSLINQYVVAPVGGEKKRIVDDAMADDENTQDEEQEEDIASRMREWIYSRHIDTVDLADVLADFPEISVKLVEDIVMRLLDEGLISKAGKDSYMINRRKTAKADACTVKEEVNMQCTPNPKQVSENGGEDVMYMKALYHALPMDYITISKLQNKLEGEVNQYTIRKLIDRMVHDGFLQNTSSRKLGRRVIHSELTQRKLQEVKRVLDAIPAAMETDGHPFDFNAVELPQHGSIPKDGSTCAALHSIGSDTTRTKGQSNMFQNGSNRSGQNHLPTAREQGNTPTSRQEPISSIESGINWREKGKGNGMSPLKAKVTDGSNGSQDNRTRKTSTVQEPILQYVKRLKTQST